MNRQAALGELDDTIKHEGSGSAEWLKMHEI
jgi:hypothetical protein